MKAKADEIGRVAVSLAGHDKGRWMVVTALEGDFALMCDGDTRTLSKPKKKRLKHLSPLPITVAVRGKGAGGGDINDSDVRKALKAAKDAYQTKLDGSRDGGAM